LSLDAFLEQPARPAGTLSYHELQGFLFAVASAPELVRPSEWLPTVFNDGDAGYATMQEARAMLDQMTALYNDINASILEGRVALPGDCHPRPQPLDNLDESAPLARWSRGFLTGHDWLEALWNVPLPAELDEEVGAVTMTLSFFASRPLAEAFHREGSSKHSFEGFAELMLRLHPEAMASYAHIGRFVIGSLPG